MRLVCTLKDPQAGASLSQYLQSKGIENELQIDTEKDWGSSQYGDSIYRIWIIDEDQVQEAQNIVEDFLKDPGSTVYQVASQKKTDLSLEPIQQALKNSSARIIQKAKETPKSFENPMGPVTRWILIICSTLFVLMSITEPDINFKVPENIPSLPVYASPIEKKLLFDYPQAYAYVDKFIKAYGVPSLHNEAQVSSEGAYLLEKAQTTPYWKGFYQIIVDFLKGKDNLAQSLEVPKFEKIKEGEIWRLFTPCLLHSDIFHILFNMLWFAILGKQLEQKLGIPRYVMFTLLVGVFSNTLQYLMGGANFIGYSGILCGMLAFIWARQRKAPWEGYLLQKSTFGFIAFFILTMFLIQVASFFTEVYYQQSLAPGIANTAHLSGALLGYLLGKMDFFSQRHI